MLKMHVRSKDATSSTTSHTKFGIISILGPFSACTKLYSLPFQHLGEARPHQLQVILLPVLDVPRTVHSSYSINPLVIDATPNFFITNIYVSPQTSSSTMLHSTFQASHWLALIVFSDTAGKLLLLQYAYFHNSTICSAHQYAQCLSFSGPHLDLTVSQATEIHRINCSAVFSTPLNYTSSSFLQTYVRKLTPVGLHRSS